VFRGRIGADDVWFHTGAWGSFAMHHPGTKVTVAGAMTEGRNVEPTARFELYERLLDEFS
jgi:hypothetical protein